ncbi:MAG: hypothetical protein IPP88_14560 [Betaproteobacteria bacterium]|nr:hypothetical protein [Betaproteobacteria bacterium]
MRNKIGILIAAALVTIFVAVFFSRSAPQVNTASANLMGSLRHLRTAQTERFQSDLRFAESNAEAAELVGGTVKLGRIQGAEPVTELNVREGGVIELLLDDKDKSGQRLRAIFLPQLAEPIGNLPIQWQCYSANWQYVTVLGNGCRHDETAGDIERKHVARLRAAGAQMERDAELTRAKYESEKAAADFERQRAQLARESERAREEEERQLARIERETERARIEYERHRQQQP